jgi:adenosylcobyric acid synthase
VEGEPRTEAGLGLLPLITTMAGAKTTTQVEARSLGRTGYGMLSAYEIHMGVTEPRGKGQPAFEIISRNGKPLKVADGWVSPDRRVWGTYLHGLFDNDGFRQGFLEELRNAHPAGARVCPELSYQNFQEAQLDRLAELLRRHLDIAQIKTMIQPVK